MELLNQLHRKWPSCNGEYDLTSGTAGPVTLFTVKTGYTLVIEELTVTIETSTAATMTFGDSAASSIFLAKTDASPGVSTQYSWKWPKGRSFTAAKNFVLTLSAAGLVANIQWKGHQKKAL